MPSLLPIHAEKNAAKARFTELVYDMFSHAPRIAFYRRSALLVGTSLTDNTMVSPATASGLMPLRYLNFLTRPVFHLPRQSLSADAN